MTPGALRTREISAHLLRECYVDAETGLVRSVRITTSGGCPLSEAELALEPGQDTARRAHGRTLDFSSTWFTAVAEALERRGGQWPPRGQAVVRAPYIDITDDAVNPTTLGLYPDERYDLPGFPYRRYHPEDELGWVWGYSFARQTPVLVPGCCAYPDYGTRSTPATSEAFVQETSSGSAVGSCLEEAIIHALLEVAERDALLMTWHARLPVPRVELTSATDRRVPLLAERAMHLMNYQILAFDITMEQGIPSFWTMAVDRAPSQHRLRTLCTANAHLDPSRALLGALYELVTLLDTLSDSFDPVASAKLLSDPQQVRTIPDHTLRYAHPDAFTRFSFLPMSGPARRLAESTEFTGHDDLTADLTELIGRYVDSGLEVIVVDQTSSEHRAAGLTCVKVLVPGTLPMTFGHDFRRIEGIPRLYSVPRLLGHMARDLRADDINIEPHPFS